VSWIGDSKILSKTVFIRECYIRLMAKALQLLRKRDYRRRNCPVVIQGNPKIGKTSFAYFVLTYLAQKGVSVVYERRFDHRRYLFTPEFVAVGVSSNFAFDIYLQQPSTFYIVDGFPVGTNSQAQTIVICNPCRTSWLMYKDTYMAELLFMPVWSENELLDCRELLYSNITVDDVKTNLIKWGGIPAYVFLPSTEIHQTTAIVEDAVKLVRSVQFYPQFDSMRSHVFLLVTAKVDKEFNLEWYMFLSDHIRDSVYHYLMKTDEKTFLVFISPFCPVFDEPWIQIRASLLNKHAGNSTFYEEQRSGGIKQIIDSDEVSGSARSGDNGEDKDAGKAGGERKKTKKKKRKKKKKATKVR
jgi:hypothetical protein